ncbi:acetyltransferase [Stenotrophomonas sp.]|uniref:acetyltransferase n=1 Tax=Stenotrophomonas sp. TaxID=69392 RepID=UPI0028B151FF|nr:acetyltransferase [Stenotrophomonas sp.]
MWWNELNTQTADLASLVPKIHPTADVAPTAILVGAVEVGAGARICHGAYILGPVRIGAHCVIGNNALVRGSTTIGDRTRIGFASELKNCIIKHDVMIGPQCFVADSCVDAYAYLGAQVRTSNHRLDGADVRVMVDGALQDTGCNKLGALIGSHASLGVQVITLPGRIVAPYTQLGPRITVERNLPAGRYVLRQCVAAY